MPINPALALQVKGFELPDPMAQMAQATQIQNALQQQRMGDIQMQNALRQQQQQRKYESIVAGFAPNMPIGERVRALQTEGLASQAAQLAKTESELSEQQRKEALAGVNLANAKAEIVARYFPNVEDQNSYSQARLKAIATGQVKPTELPEQYDKNFVDALLKAGVSLKDQIANVFREREVGARETSAQAAASQAKTAAQKALRDRVPMSVQEFEAYNRMPPEQQAAFTAFQASKRPQTNIQMPPGEKAEEVKRGEKFVKQEIDVGNAATAARKSLVGIQSAQDVLNRGFDTGFLTETKAKAASVLAGLGVADAEKYATDAQKFLQAATERVLAAQLDQKGVQTNQDAQRIEQAGARMGNTKAANEFILDVARAQAERAIAHDKFYRDWLRDPENKNSLRGAEDAWLESEGNKSIFESPRLKKYGVLAAERMQAAPAPQGPVVGGRSATPRGAAPAGERAFRTVQEAEAANLPSGTRITINGRPAIVE